MSLIKCISPWLYPWKAEFIATSFVLLGWTTCRYPWHRRYASVRQKLTLHFRRTVYLSSWNSVWFYSYLITNICIERIFFLF